MAGLIKAFAATLVLCLLTRGKKAIFFVSIIYLFLLKSLKYMLLSFLLSFFFLKEYNSARLCYEHALFFGKSMS